MRSSLGLHRIRNLDISQVLHATDADILLLRTHLSSWGVSSFNSYPLLLRALTHPSISNWAERTLRLPARSLGPSTLELLGDRVVGACISYRVLQWIKQQSTDMIQSNPAYVTRSLEGNRGMAFVARDIGIDKLLRWERARPPSAHRQRLDSHGMDVTTGISCNVEVNALAAAYEAVTAAIYLDCGFASAETFVCNTLLRDAKQVQYSNIDSVTFEKTLLALLSALLNKPISFVGSRFRAGRDGNLAKKSFEYMQCEVLDLEAVEQVNPAHMLYYAAISLRRMNSVDKAICEEDIVYVASHFSVETARIAALKKAVQHLNGEARASVKKSDSDVVALRMREAVYGSGAPVLEVRLMSDGLWYRDGDYAHLARLLGRVGLEQCQVWKDMHVAEIRERIGEVWKERDGGKGMGRCGHGHGHGHGDKWDWTAGEVDVGIVEECLNVGRDVMDGGLQKEYAGLRGDVKSGELVCSTIKRSMKKLEDVNMSERRKIIKGYNVIGRQCLKLWSVQRSMKDVSEDRSEVIGQSEIRGRQKVELGRGMIGRADLHGLAGLANEKALVGLGVCVEDVDVTTALAWLSGAEQKIAQ